MKKLLTLMLLTISMLAFSQKSSEKYHISKYAKVESDGTFKYQDFSGHIEFKYEESKIEQGEIHFCAGSNHYDFLILIKNSEVIPGEKFDKFEMRGFIIKDYNVSNTKEFDLQFTQWGYVNGKVFFTLKTESGTYHYQISKLERYENGVLVSSESVVQ